MVLAAPTVVDVSGEVLDAADVILSQRAQRSQRLLLILLGCQLVHHAIIKILQLRVGGSCTKSEAWTLPAHRPSTRRECKL